MTYDWQRIMRAGQPDKTACYRVVIGRHDARITDRRHGHEKAFVCSIFLRHELVWCEKFKRYDKALEATGQALSKFDR